MKIHRLVQVVAGMAILGWSDMIVRAGDYEYTTTNGTVTITGYKGTNVVVVIPDTINGLPVTVIGDRAFFFRTSVTSVTIPNSVTSIGDLAFYACTNLTGVVIPDSVTRIGSGAFGSCSSLTSVVIPN